MYLHTPFLGDDPIRDRVPSLPTVVRGTAAQVVSCSAAERDQISAAAGKTMSVDEIKEAIRLAMDGAARWADTSAEALKPEFRNEAAIKEHFMATFGVPVTKSLKGTGGQPVNAANLVQTRFLSASRYLREANPRVRCLAACPGRTVATSSLCVTGDRLTLGTKFWLAFGHGDETALRFGMMAAAFVAYYGMSIDHATNPFRSSRRYATFAMQLFGESTPRFAPSPSLAAPAGP